MSGFNKPCRQYTKIAFLLLLSLCIFSDEIVETKQIFIPVYFACFLTMYFSTFLN